jgi:diguanylate cyclase (GGDEF)-like protein/PAS domain S-box-containing protein
MLRIIGCITEQHDLRLVAVAACICVLACATTISLLTGVQIGKQRAPLTHLVAAAIVFGSGVWSLHFVAMLAYLSDVPIAYSISSTFASILFAVVGAGLAFSVWRFSPSKPVGIVIGGILLGSSISAMHFCGVMAMEVSGAVHFDDEEVVRSIGACVALAVMALARAGTLSTYRQRTEAVVWLALSICGLHFVAMTGLSFEPGPPNDQQAVVLGTNGLAVTVGSISLAILVASLAASLMEQYLSQRAVMELQRMRTLNDLSREVLIICRDGIALQINAAGNRMFAMPGRQLVGGRVLDLVDESHRPVLLRQLEHHIADPGHREISLVAANGVILTAEMLTTTIDYEGKPAVAIAFRDMSDRKQHEARIRHLAHHDALTDLPNRFLLQERLSYALDAAARSGAFVALLYLDLDRFKAVNDQFGHAAGDALLIEVAKRLLANIRSIDTLARIGGDEFVILAAFERPEEVALLAGRLIDSVTQTFDLDVGQVEIGLSIGVAFYPQDCAAGQELMRAADVALYRAKHEGRGTFRFFEKGMDEHLQARQQLERDLRIAIERNQLLLHYQPLVSATTGEVEGFEALLRWQHPERGMIPPLEFIPLAEETGLILMIGRWVLETACAAAASWDNQNWVAVNVSPAQFRSGDLAETISSVLARTGLAPHRLEIEVTEGILMEEPKRAADVLSAVRALGVRIAMDDFGTGYSSLSYLHEFKFDKLKIDRSFVKRLGEAQEATSIITAIVGLARQLGLSVVAEGVETTTQLNTLRDLKCDLIQGYLVGRPMQMDAPTELMAARARMFFSGALAGSSVDAGANQNNQQDEANAVAQRTD